MLIKEIEVGEYTLSRFTDGEKIDEIQVVNFLTGQAEADAWEEVSPTNSAILIRVLYNTAKKKTR